MAGGESRAGKEKPARQWATGAHLDEQFLSVVTLYELEVGGPSLERRDPV
jgi:hypothetical protein